MNIKYFLGFLLIVTLMTTGCGGGGGGGGAKASGGGNGPAPIDNSVQAKVKRDVDSLNTIGIFKASSTSTNTDFAKIFGGFSPINVKDFINLRAKQVYSYDEAVSFKIDFVAPNGQSLTKSWKEMPDYEKPTADSGLLGQNFGTALAEVGKASDFKVYVNFPKQRQEVKSSRIGFIGMTPSYFNIATGVANPLASRLGIVIHEGRHSDCPDYNSDKCGYSHKICPPGHDYAGLAACEQIAWGAYAVEKVYIDAVLGNYDKNTQERVILDYISTDLQTRLTDDIVNEMKVTDPDLTSL